MLRDGKDITLPNWFWPSSISAAATSLLLGLLHYDPSVRFTASEAVNHPWCTGSFIIDSLNKNLLYNVLFL